MRKVKYATVPIESLVPDPDNPRNHTDFDLEKTRAALEAHGLVSPLLVQKGTKRIIHGNGRYQCLVEMGHKTVDVAILDCDDTEAKRLAVTLNKTGENAGWNDDVLARLLRDFKEQDESWLDSLGFKPGEMNKLIMTLNMAPGGGDNEPIPDPPKDPVTKPGNIWHLGKHRLICGDATSEDDVKRLMGDDRADICFTSPPYALGKSIKLRKPGATDKDSAYDDHKDDPAEWMDLMNGFFHASHHAVLDAWLINVQMLAGNKRDLISWINTRSNRLVDIITWDKGHAAPAMAEGVLSSRFEWIIVMGEDGASRVIPCSSWRGTVQSLYEGPPQRVNEFADIHAATMPTHLPEWVFGQLCDRAKSVYEPFCGCGTTLVSAERMKRTCYAVEISPAYCDVTVQRWEDLTGKKAKLEE